MEGIEVRNELFFVLDEDIENRARLVGIGNEHLEHVERLELDVLGFIAQQVHHQFKVFLVTNILGHHVEVGSVQQQLTQQLEKKQN